MTPVTPRLASAPVACYRLPMAGRCFRTARRDGMLLRPLAGLLFVLLLPCAGAIHAQEEGAANERQTTQAPLPERIERAAKRLTDRLAAVNLYPRVTSLGTGGGPAPGLAYWDPTAGPGRLGLYGSLSQSFYGDRLIELRLGRVPHVPGKAPVRRDGLEWIPGFVTNGRSDRAFLYGEARQLNLDEGRYLLGHSAPLRQDSLDMVGGYRIAPHLALSVRTGFLQVTPTSGAGVLDRPFSPALESQGLPWRRDFLRVSSELAWDSRLQPRSPTGGSFVSLMLEHYHDRGVAPGFSRASLDVRRFQPLGSERHLVALRGFASVAATEGAQVPFYRQYTLGGSSVLRSYPEHRFSGDRLLAFSAEYRFSPLPWLELAGFADVGGAWGGFLPLGTDGFRRSTGIGVRLKTRDAVLIRADVARGDEGTRLNLKLGYSF